jgi:N utilization substance protein B
MPARSKARKRALDILFEAELRGLPVLGLLAERAARASPPVSAYAAELVRGVQEHQEGIDEMLATHSTGWALDRMPAVDRNILRIAAYELLWGTGVPDAVAISEAVLLARDLSTDASPGFINGLLARLLELRPQQQAASSPDPSENDQVKEGEPPPQHKRLRAAEPAPDTGPHPGEIHDHL